MQVLWTTLLGCVLLVPQIAVGESASSIAGVVSGPDNELLADVPIQLKHSETGDTFRARTSNEGDYEFSDLTFGAYSLTIVMPCCAYRGVPHDEIELLDGQALTHNIQLQEGVSLNTFGDDPITIANLVRDRQIIPDLPVPRLADGRPDLSGVWLVNQDPYPEKPQPLPWAKQVSEERIANHQRNNPHNSCLPGGLPIPSGGSPFIGKFVQTPGLVVILLEDVPGYRQIFVDGREHPEDPNPSWMGHSVGHWDGDTLIVDTVGFNTRGWTGTYPRSEKMRMTERYQRTEYGRMTAEIIFDDTEVFSAPFTKNLSFDLAPQEELIEYVCENNKWAPTN
ncbi:MAG: carboxypeptidase-like regulatory domain-containing protein [Gammaproteobacteria bacterium]|nr:carboxypeptidase-like regulatory domain-containing protein [Gammaproteobacteria bacterium]